MVNIKRFSRNKKFYYAARDKNGRFVSVRRARRGINTESLKTIFFKTGTLYKDKERAVLTSPKAAKARGYAVAEEVRYTKKPSFRRGQQVQAVAQITINKIKYHARSDKFPASEFEAAKEQALNRVYNQMSYELTEEYSETKGKRIFNAAKRRGLRPSIKIGSVQYVQVSA